MISITPFGPSAYVRLLGRAVDRTMKVAHVTVSGEVAGGQVICERLVEALRKRGDQAIVVSPASGTFTERLIRKQIPVFFIPFRRTYHFENALRFSRLLRSERVDLVHTHAMVQVNVHARLGACLAGVPVVSHLHLPNHFRDHLVIRAYQVWLDNLTAKWCDALIAVSEATKVAFAAQGRAYGRAEVVYNGIDLDRCRNLKARESIFQEFGLGSCSRLIGTVGRLCPMKGQKEFIRAAREVLVQIPQAVFMVVGEDCEKDGSYEQELRHLAIELGLDGKLMFTGYRPDVLDLVNAFDVFVLPSKIEGLPVAILEAMALSKAVVATKVGGVSELVVDGETGILVSPDDHSALSREMINLIQNPNQAKRMGELGRGRVENQFQEREMIDRILNLYERILTKGRRNGVDWN